MVQLSFINLFVADIARSRSLYDQLLGAAPLMTTPTYVLYDLGAVKFALWARAGVAPPADAAGGGAEYAFAHASAAEVDARFEAWRALDVSVLAEPGPVDFGYAFTLADPDGHRLCAFHMDRRG